MTNYKLGIAEIYWPGIHDMGGYDETNLACNWMVCEIFKKNQLNNFYNIKKYNKILDWYKGNINREINNVIGNGQDSRSRCTKLDLYPHPIVRNFDTIVSNNNYIKFDILQYILDETTGCACAILKTHFIRIIQKKWKKIYAERINIINERNKYQNIDYYNKYNIWPSNCQAFPSLKGMLSDLVTTR